MWKKEFNVVDSRSSETPLNHPGTIGSWVVDYGSNSPYPFSDDSTGIKDMSSTEVQGDDKGTMWYRTMWDRETLNRKYKRVSPILRSRVKRNLRVVKGKGRRKGTWVFYYKSLFRPQPRL